MRKFILSVLACVLVSGMAFAGLQINPVTGKLDKTGAGGVTNITSSGSNIGIGSTAPGNTLDVQGTFRTSGASTLAANVGIGTAVTLSELHVAGAGAQSPILYLQTGTGGSTKINFRVAGTNIGGIGTSGANEGDTSSDLGIFAATARGIRFYVAGSGTNSMNLTSAGNLTVPGNIGIGAGTGASILDISKSTAGNVQLTVTNTNNASNANSVIRWVNDAANFGQAGLTSSTTGGTTGPNMLVIDNETAGGGIQFSANAGNEYMRVNGAGNIGIGTINPQKKFCVGSTCQGGVDTSGNITTSGGYTQTGTTANTFTGTSTFNNATYPILTSGGNVGIGYATPFQALIVSQTSATAFSSNSFWGNTFGGVTIKNPSDTANTVAGLQFMNGSANTAMSGIAGIEESTVLGGMVFVTNSGASTPERMRITSAGNVGIGTSAPAGLLAIGGNVLLDRTTSAIIMKESDGTCGSCVLSAVEVFTCSSIACP